MVAPCIRFCPDDELKKHLQATVDGLVNEGAALTLGQQVRTFWSSCALNTIEAAGDDFVCTIGEKTVALRRGVHIFFNKGS